MKKRCLFLDFLFEQGHKEFNTPMINLLSEMCDLTVLDYNNYYDKTRLPNNIETIEYNDNHIRLKNKKLSEKLYLINRIKKMSKIIKQTNFDYYIIASFEIVSMYFGNLFLPKSKNMILIHHNDIDQTENKYKNFLFRSIASKYKHAVLEEFIREHFVNKYKFLTNSTYVVHIPVSDCVMKKTKDTKNIDAAGLSNSNDKSFVDDIYYNEIEKEKLKKEDLRIILKSKHIEYDSKNLTIFKGRIETEEYNNIILNSKFIILPYPKTYKNRSSGVLIDALSNNKQIICTEFKLALELAKLYPNICFIASNYYELINVLKTIDHSNNEIKEIEFSKFKHLHSKEYIKEQWRRIFTDE